jgi:serine/threonine-protein kinase RsbW
MNGAGSTSLMDQAISAQPVDGRRATAEDTAAEEDEAAAKEAAAEGTAVELGPARATAPTGTREVVLPGIPASVPAARRFARDCLADCPRLDDLVLAVSELASNAIAWSASGCGGTFTVRVRTAPRWARVEVTDAGPAPVPATTSNGWGLGIVAEVTDRAGDTIAADGQRTAWAEATWPR